MPAVSVIIPTYNHRDYVLAALDSVFRQTFTDYEVIVINDGSPDDTGQLLKPLAETGKIRYLEQDNKGQSAARNLGLSLATGEFIALLDDDDIWPADKLHWQFEMLKQSAEVGVVGGRIEKIDETGIPQGVGISQGAITFETLFESNPFHSPGQTMIRSSLLKEVGNFNSSIWGADDWDLWFRISKRAKIVMAGRTALYYRVHSENATRRNIERMLKNCCKVVESHFSDLDHSVRKQVQRRCYHYIYQGLGGSIVNKARTNLKHGRLSSAMRSMAGLYALRKGLIAYPRLAGFIVRDVFRGTARNALELLGKCFDARRSISNSKHHKSL